VSEISYELIRNPRPSLLDVLLSLPYRVPPEVIGLSAEELCDTEAPLGWPEPLRDWHRESCGWIPADLLRWWMQWFAQEPRLDRMPLGWWLHRTMALAVARDGVKPVGVGALTVVMSGEGYQLPSDDPRPLLYEIRSTVVERSYRRRGIFKQILRELLRGARALGAADGRWKLATFLATSNPQLQELLGRLDMEDDEIETQAQFTIRMIACWCGYWVQPSCAVCPRLSGNARGWETCYPLSSGQQQDKLW
jgi:GNAT superfamily N-acetyltransferase